MENKQKMPKYDGQIDLGKHVAIFAEEYGLWIHHENGGVVDVKERKNESEVHFSSGAVEKYNKDNVVIYK